MEYFKEMDGTINTEEAHNLERDFMKTPDASLGNRSDMLRAMMRVMKNLIRARESGRVLVSVGSGNR